jgi:hypothetical protein
MMGLYVYVCATGSLQPLADANFSLSFRNLGNGNYYVDAGQNQDFQVADLHSQYGCFPAYTVNSHNWVSMWIHLGSSSCYT